MGYGPLNLMEFKNLPEMSSRYTYIVSISNILKILEVLIVRKLMAKIVSLKAKLWNLQSITKIFVKCI